jgi:hypothetical protein
MIHPSTAHILAIGANKASTFTLILPSTSLSGLQYGFKLCSLSYSTNIYPGLKNDTSIKISKMPTSVSIPIMNPSGTAIYNNLINEECIDWFNTWFPLMPVDFLNLEKPTPFKLLGLDNVVWNDGQVVQGGIGKPIEFGSNICSMVGRSMSHSLKILSLGLGASKTEIKVHYMQLAHKYHPDKNVCAATGLTMEEATEFFKLLNNMNDSLKERA